MFISFIVILSQIIVFVHTKEHMYFAFDEYLTDFISLSLSFCEIKQNGTSFSPTSIANITRTSFQTKTFALYIPTFCAILHYVPCTCGSIYSSLYTSILVVKEGSSSSRSLVHLSEHWACQQLMWLLPAKNCPQEFEKPLGWPQNDNSPKCCLAFATSLS